MTLPATFQLALLLYALGITGACIGLQTVINNRHEGPTAAMWGALICFGVLNWLFTICVAVAAALGVFG